MDEKLDKLQENLAGVQATLAVHTEILGRVEKDVAHHIKRTDLLEDKLLTLPLRILKWVFAVIAGLSTLMGLFAAAKQIL